MNGERTQSNIYMYPFSPKLPLPSRLPHDIEQSSLSWTAGPFWLSVLNIAVCTCPSQTPYRFLRSIPAGNHKFILKVCDFLSVLYINHLYGPMTIKPASFLIYSVILVSNVQHSGFHIYIYIIFQILFPYLLLLLFSG